MQTIKCLYSCINCGINDNVVEVPARNADQNIVDWFKNICIIAIAKDHRTKSLYCNATELTNLKITITGAEFIGGPASN